MYLKTHASPDGEIVALCDIELIGKVLASGKARLDLSAYAPFYLGKKVDEKEAVEALKSAQNANIVGKRALEAAKKAGFAVSHAKMIGGVPHLQLYALPP
ncbi:MAG: DUF424 domain-containing protein [Candidatus Micrarchaeia archaeon]|jgi:hypothetical protein